MKTDRELLELAAKAIGVKFYSTPDDGRGLCLGCGDSTLWNPLDDDSDALRLSVRLGIQIWHRPGNRVEGIHKGSVLTKPNAESLNPNPFVATRRAIVRAAAEIGEISG